MSVHESRSAWGEVSARVVRLFRRTELSNFPPLPRASSAPATLRKTVTNSPHLFNFIWSSPVFFSFHAQGGRSCSRLFIEAFLRPLPGC